MEWTEEKQLLSPAEEVGIRGFSPLLQGSQPLDIVVLQRIEESDVAGLLGIAGLSASGPPDSGIMAALGATLA